MTMYAIIVENQIKAVSFLEKGALSVWLRVPCLQKLHQDEILMR